MAQPDQSNTELTPERADRRNSGVWHKDGPIAQIRAMADWVEPDQWGEPSRETLGKVAKNLRAACDALDEGER